jgi:hypothetical protein
LGSRQFAREADELVVLGDLDLEAIAQVKAQHEEKIRNAQREADRFEWACKYIEPLLRKNPGWKWRDAVKWLSEHGGLPRAKRPKK